MNLVEELGIALDIANNLEPRCRNSDDESSIEGAGAEIDDGRLENELRAID